MLNFQFLFSQSRTRRKGTNLDYIGYIQGWMIRDKSCVLRKERKSGTNKLEKRTKVVKLYGGNEVKWDTLFETTNPSELSLRNPKKETTLPIPITFLIREGSRTPAAFIKDRKKIYSPGINNS